MNSIVKLRSSEIDKIVYSIHFWIIITITVAIAIIYYSWYDWFIWFWRFSIFEFKNSIIGSLFFIPFLHASLVFWLRGALIVWLLSMAAILPRMVYYSFDVASLASNVAFSLIPLTVVIIINFELKWRERQRQISAEREEERQIYMSQIFKAHEDERGRIAQELHDDITQELLVIANRAQTLVLSDNNETTEEARRDAEWIRDAIIRVEEDLRRLGLDLRPSILDNLGLVPAIRWLVGRLNEEGETSTEMVINGRERKLRPESEIAIFRVVQEALNNVRRHSKATKAVVTLGFDPEFVRITVRDNGTGFPLRETLGILAAEGKSGLVGMQERVKLLNGTFDIHSQLSQGTLVSIEIKG